MDVPLPLIALLSGVLIAAMTFAGLPSYETFIDFVEADLSDRLKSLRFSSPHVRRWIQLWLAIVAVTFFMIWLGLDLIAIGGCAALFMCAGPWYLIRRLSQMRRQKIEEQLADAMVMFSSAVRAGLSLPQALELLSKECPNPIRQEFAQLVGEYKLGKPLERTMNEAKARLKSENFVLFTAALLASRESGGKLNETVERIATSVLELQRLERKIMSETAQARKSALYMAIAPPLILAAYAWLDPAAINVLFTSVAGQLMLCTSVVLNVIAYAWALHILRTDI